MNSMEVSMVLGSGSPRRREILKKLGFTFQVVTSDAEEICPQGMDPEEVCVSNARLKARSVAQKHPRCGVIGADTLVCLGDELLGKPRSMEEAEVMLSKLSGRGHRVITGVCLVYGDGNLELSFAEVTNVVFHELDTATIRRYLGSIEPLDKAGGYAIQENGEWIVKAIEGSFSNVVGFPEERFQLEWARFCQAISSKESSEFT